MPEWNDHVYLWYMQISANGIHLNILIVICYFNGQISKYEIGYQTTTVHHIVLYRFVYETNAIFSGQTTQCMEARSCSPSEKHEQISWTLHFNQEKYGIFSVYTNILCSYQLQSKIVAFAEEFELQLKRDAVFAYVDGFRAGFGRIRTETKASDMVSLLILQIKLFL